MPISPEILGSVIGPTTCAEKCRVRRLCKLGANGNFGHLCEAKKEIEKVKAEIIALNLPEVTHVVVNHTDTLGANAFFEDGSTARVYLDRGKRELTLFQAVEILD